MRAAWLIARKDLLLRMRDRSAIIVGLVAPLVLAFIFNAVFGGVFGQESITTIGYSDEDGGAVAVSFGQALTGLEDEGIIAVEVFSDLDELRAAVDDGEVPSGINVPSGFSQAALAGEPAEVAVVAHIEAPTSTAIAEGIASAFASAVEDSQRAVGAVQAMEMPSDPDVFSRVAEAASRATPVATVGEVAAANRVLDPATFFAAGMAVFFLFFLVQYGVTGLLEEEHDGTLARLGAAPIPRWSVIVAKGLTSFILGVVAMTVLAVASTYLMGADWGDPLGAGILIVGVTLAATSTIGVVGAFARTAEGAGNLASIIAVALGMLGGTFFPVAGGNAVVEALSLATPHAWFLRGIGAQSAGDGLAAIVPAVAALALFTVVVGLVAAILLKRRFA